MRVKLRNPPDQLCASKGSMSCSARSNHDNDMQGHEAHILNVAPGRERTTFRRPYSFADRGPDDERHEALTAGRTGSA
jgi:hypothetical protein